MFAEAKCVVFNWQEAALHLLRLQCQELEEEKQVVCQGLGMQAE